MWAKTRMVAALGYLKRSQKTITEQVGRRAGALTVRPRAIDADKPAIGLDRSVSLLHHICGLTVPRAAQAGDQPAGMAGESMGLSRKIRRERWAEKLGEVDPADD